MWAHHLESRALRGFFVRRPKLPLQRKPYGQKKQDVEQPRMTNGHVAIGIQYDMALAFVKANPDLSTEQIIQLAAVGSMIQFDAVIDQHYPGKSAPEITSKLRNVRLGEAR
ncbi:MULTISPECIES: hypothetical protein [unclassified Pseudomonas]|uniref:hypothetical protein n=1 Tax=unclassified Pseudomonas TaxID=196821 RepID=UPI001587C24D|nr:MULTISPECIES: hypothetical protein [unclassified Pseudomonas]